jgi:hypothetical protein
MKMKHDIKRLLFVGAKENEKIKRISLYKKEIL